MKSCLFRLAAMLLLVATACMPGYAQGGGLSSSLTGTVVDASGAVIPGADILVKNNATGTEYKTVTVQNGTFFIPGISPGTYSAAVSMPSFKQAFVKEIKIEAGVPATIRVSLEVGGSNETVIVEAGADVVQSQTANISTTLGTRQISQLPLVSRNALDYIPLMPGANTTGNNNRGTTLVGLPESMINISIDGVSSQDNYLKSSDGFFSIVRASLDAIEEVTLSTATPGAESAGQGAIQIKFVTRSGNNEFHGSLYEYHRNSALNANSWFNNRNITAPPGADPRTWKAPPEWLILNQFGGRIGGPIQIPKLFDGRDKAFFFLNIEESRQPNQATRNQTVLSPESEKGNFLYQAQGQTRSVNLFDLAASKGQVATWDPTVQKLLADIRASTAQGSLREHADPRFQTLTFVNKGMNRTRFITSRFDFNLTGNHRVEFSHNHHKYYALPYDNTNGYSPAYPGFPNWGMQGSNRFSGTLALRSTLTPRIVNEARAGLSSYTVVFNPNLAADMFSGDVANMDGFTLGISAAGLSNPYVFSTGSRRSAPSKMFEDTLNWNEGVHSLSFGFAWTQVSAWNQSLRTVPSISFGVDTTYDPARIMFDSSNGTRNFPGASSSQITNARNLYAVLTGRVTSIGASAYLDEVDDQYKYQGNTMQRGHMREIGSFAADSWRVRPNLTLTLGLRWEFQYPFVAENNMYSTATIADVFGISGIGNLFDPTKRTGKAPEFVQYSSGSPGYNLQKRDFAPSFGFAWTAGAREGLLGRLLGRSGETVLRGGYSIAYSRNGISTYMSMYSGNTGSSLTATRNVALADLVPAGESWPVLFRDKGRLGPPPFPTAPSYPITARPANPDPAKVYYFDTEDIEVVDPGLKTPYAQSWTFGIQREISRSMALEVRYVGTRGLQFWNQYNYNSVENRMLENGTFDEFKLAMANLEANIASGRGNNFRYSGPGTGTYPLPIALAFISGYTADQANDPSKYNSSQFTNSTFVNPLAARNPNPGSYIGALHSDPARRANGAKAGYPANFFLTNPDLRGGASIDQNGGYSRYDSMVIEFRRRLSKGLLLDANYVWAKAFSSSTLSFRRDRVMDITSYAPHAFKANWVYELPFGRGQMLFADIGNVVDKFIGGWNFQGTARIQSADLEDFGNVILVGMTDQELRDVYGLRFDDANRHIYVLPEDIRTNTIAAFNVSATSPTGYSSTYGVPTGRYIAPANSAGCIQVISGDCAPRHVYMRGAPFVNFDLSVTKQVRFGETKNFELRGEFLNAFNNVNFNYVSCASSSANCGEVTSAASGGRIAQIVLRLNF